VACLITVGYLNHQGIFYYTTKRASVNIITEEVLYQASKISKKELIQADRD
jgi:hypothetical protein